MSGAQLAEALIGVQAIASKCRAQLSTSHVDGIRDAYASCQAQSDKDQLPHEQNEVSEDHWLHDNVEGAAQLLLLMNVHESHACVQGIFQTAIANVKDCPQCVVSYHTAKGMMKELYGDELSQPALDQMQRLDEIRVSAAILRAHANPKSDIQAEAVTALFETLSFAGLLDDQEVVSEMEQALLKLSKYHDLALTEGGRYPGVYKLLAHHSSGLRDLVTPIVQGMGKFEDESDVDAVLSILQEWCRILSGAGKSQAPAANSTRPRSSWHTQFVWQALSVVLDLMDGNALQYLLQAVQLTERSAKNTADLLSMIWSYAMSASPLSWPGMACIRALYTHGNDQVLVMLNTDLSTVDQICHIAEGSFDENLQIQTVRALSAILTCMSRQPRRSSSGPELCISRRVLHALLVRLTTASAVKLKTKHIAEKEAYSWLLEQIQGDEDVSDAAHIFGPHLCRQLSPNLGPESPNHQLMLDVAQALLDSDVARLIQINTAQMQDRGLSETCVAPCLWKGLAECGNSKIRTKVMEAAAKLAHTPSGEAQMQKMNLQQFGHFTDAGRTPRIELSWPKLIPNECHLSNPFSVRVEAIPGLLLQSFREIAAHLLDSQPFAETDLTTAQDNAGLSLIESHVLCMTGIHKDLRSASESSLLKMTNRSTFADALGYLLWNQELSVAVFQALRASLAALDHQNLHKAMTGANTAACLTITVQALQASEDTGRLDVVGRKELVDTCRSFCIKVLRQCKDLGRIGPAAVSIRLVFTLLPILLDLRMNEAARSSASKAVWRKELAFTADLIQWGSHISVGLSPQWQAAFKNIMKCLPGPVDEYLPDSALQAGRVALHTSSTTSDEIKLFLAPLLGASAPGNLGLPTLNFPSRAQKPATINPAKSKPVPDLGTLGRNFGQKGWLKTEAGVKPERDLSTKEVDVYLTSSDDEPLAERIKSGRMASTSETKMPAWMNEHGVSQTHNSSANFKPGTLEAGQKEPASHIESATDYGYSSDTPIEKVIEEQKRFFEMAQKNLVRQEPWRENKQNGKKTKQGQKTLGGYVSISPHTKGEPKQIIPPATQDRYGGIDMESMYSLAKHAKADSNGNKEAQKAVQNAVKPKTKSKLKAMIEQEDLALKQANRKFSASDNPEKNFPRKRQKLSPEPGSTSNMRPAATSSALPITSKQLQADDDLESRLRSAQTRVKLPAVPERRSLIPAAPRPVRKAIQLSQDPGMKAQAIRRPNAVVRPQKYEKALSLEKVHEDILTWDLHTVTASHSSSKLAKIPTRFVDLAQYAKSFWSLMYEELRAHIQQAIEEGTDSQKRKPKSSRQSDEASSISLVVAEVQKRTALSRVDFTFSAGEREACRAEDLVLLTRVPLKTAIKSVDPGCVHALGLVVSIENSEENKGQRVATINVNTSSKGGSLESARQDLVSRGLLKGTTWHCTTILSWIPHQRQFQALCNAHTLPTDLVHQLIAPSPPESASLHAPNLPASLTAVLEENYNQSQFAAIRSACATDTPFTLIQGPPGTGKTSTVIGIVSALLANQSWNVAPQSNGISALKAIASRQKPAARGPKPVGLETGNKRGPPKMRVLVCAQSNAAIDELIMRLSEPGLFNAQGTRRVPSMVRLGKLESTHESIKAYHIDFLSTKAESTDETAAAIETNSSSAEQEVIKLRSELAAAKKALQEAESKQAVGKGGDVGDQPGDITTLGSLRDKRRRVGIQLKQAIDKRAATKEQCSRARKEIRQAVVQHAEVVTCTLSSAGGDLMALSKGLAGFQALIIDEAAQAVEPSALIAFQLLAPASKIVLVGDPQQLPPTILSKTAEAANLSQSLFQRLQQAKWPVSVLSEQFRMHPRISAWPSAYFYARKLVNGAIVKTDTWSADFHKLPCFPPLALFDCSESRESRSRLGGSVANPMEAELVITLLKGMMRKFPSTMKNSIAILTPYKSQVTELHALAALELTKSQMQHIEISTVDAFQGKEADVVFFSCVRARAHGTSSSIGFLADVRRMNVALTRARRGMYVVGHVKTLSSSPPWLDFISHCRRTNCLFKAQEPYNAILTCTTAELVEDDQRKPYRSLSPEPQDPRTKLLLSRGDTAFPADLKSTRGLDADRLGQQVIPLSRKRLSGPCKIQKAVLAGVSPSSSEQTVKAESKSALEKAQQCMPRPRSRTPSLNKRAQPSGMSELKTATSSKDGSLANQQQKGSSEDKRTGMLTETASASRPLKKSKLSQTSTVVSDPFAGLTDDVPPPPPLTASAPLPENGDEPLLPPGFEDGVFTPPELKDQGLSISGNAPPLPNGSPPFQPPLPASQPPDLPPLPPQDSQTWSQPPLPTDAPPD